MAGSINMSRFDSLVRLADSRNRGTKGGKRFYPIHTREGKYMIFGLYDYISKQYTLSAPYSNVDDVFDDMERMLNAA